MGIDFLKKFTQTYLHSTLKRAKLQPETYSGNVYTRGSISQFCFIPKRWHLPTTSGSLSSPDAWTHGPRLQSLCSHGGPHSNRPGSSGGGHHRDRTAGGNVPDVTCADSLSTLSAGDRDPHLSRCGSHEHTLLPLLFLRWVSRVTCDDCFFFNVDIFRGLNAWWLFKLHFVTKNKVVAQ